VRAPIINGAAQGGEGASSSTAGTGRAKERRKAILDGFRAQSGFGVLILSPFVAGIGLTITEANHVIHYGRWWNPAVEAQATDRAYRIGQTRPVYVYLPILEDPSGRLTRTFDQALDALLTSKADLARDFLEPADVEEQCAEELVKALRLETGGPGVGRERKAFSGEDLDALEPTQFEAGVAALYRALGYRVVLTAVAGDGGADVIAVKGASVTLVQAKHSATGKPVDVSAVNDVLGAMDIYGTDLIGYNLTAVIVTNSTFGKMAQNEAKQRGVELISRSLLVELMKANQVGLGRMVASASDRAKNFSDGVSRVRSLLNANP
jgi:hypothetical protein